MDTVHPYPTMLSLSVSWLSYFRERTGCRLSRPGGISSGIVSVSAPVSASTCGATDCDENTFGAMSGGLPVGDGDDGGGGDGGFDRGCGDPDEDCAPLPEAGAVPLNPLESKADESDVPPELPVWEFEEPAVDPELGVDDWANAIVNGERLRTRITVTDTAWRNLPWPRL